MKWPLVPLRAVGRTVTGRTPAAAEPECFGDLAPFLTPSDMSFDTRSVITERAISHIGLERFSRAILPANAVCVVCIGATIGKICMTDAPTLTNQQLNSVICDANLADPHFVYYSLRLKRDELISKAAGAATPIINKSAFEQIEIWLPPLSLQRRIARILCAYDDLIEVNTRRIAILEEMARRLFDEWFVRFRVPGSDSRANNRAPSDWVTTEVKALVERKNSGSTYRKENCEPSGNVIVVDQSAEEYLGFHSNPPDHEASPDSPLIIFGDHTCKMELLISPFSVGQNTIVFTSGHTVSVYYLFELIRGLTATREYKRHWNELIRKSVVVAPQTLTETYGDVVRPLFEFITLLRNTNRNLRFARDLLLPKLISGEIDLSTAERQMESAQ